MQQQSGLRYPSFADENFNNNKNSSQVIVSNANNYAATGYSFNNSNFNSQNNNQNIQMVQYQSGRTDQLYESRLLPNKEYLADVNVDKDKVDLQKGRKIKLFSQYKVYGGNEIKSSKYYGMPLFIFQNLWFQMHKLANIYFLVIACLQCIPAISISQGQPVILLPLIVVISVSMLKDYFEDRKRKNADQEENNRKIKVWTSSNNNPKDFKCHDLKVGHIIQIDENQLIPADLLVLEVAEKKKECYIETKNLDGETNLKIKEIPEAFRGANRFMVDPAIKVDIDYIPANKNLESFNGTIQLEENGANQTDFVESKHLLLRGCTLKTTRWVKGVVLYTGKETKIQLNSCESEQKLSSLEQMMNKFIIVIFLIQIIICFCSGIFGTLWMKENKLNLPYLQYSSHAHIGGFDFAECFQIMGTWTLIFTNFIPISLIVTLEVVKYIQGINLESDPNYPECRVQSSNLNEELGQIKYIFSDKTGTLTQNSMKFKCLSVYGESFGEAKAIDINSRDESHNFLEKTLQNNECVDFVDSYFSKLLMKGDSVIKQQIDKTLTLMALCHNVVPLGPISYSGPSPDEICLVSFAQSQGVQFINKNDDNILTISKSINQYGEKQFERYKLLHTFDFNSDRKRMSVIVQKVGNNGLLDEYILLTKGADNVMENRLLQRYDQNTIKDLTKYSEYGYRTLVLAQRKINRQELSLFEQELTRAKLQQTNNKQIIDDLQDRMEQGLEYLAVTGVEDKLQVDVADIISKIKEANINFWVLTGDKEETAISIGNAIKVIGDEESTVKVQISRLVKDIAFKNQQQNQNLNPKQLLQEAIREATSMKNFAKNKNNDTNKKVALIVKGDDLITITSDLQLKDSFVKMAIECDTVIASRVSPSQKKDIVDMVREELPHVSTLAIGDGANDVSMISAAHVGVGIRGKEGTQAERSSDYAIPEFRFLGNLLFDFGRECYRRNSELVLYNFYKNMLLVLPQWWFGLHNGFSGVTLYDPWLYQLYNTCFTALPIVVYAIEDRQYPMKKLMKYPLDYYEQGQTNRLFSLLTFLQTIFKGFIDAGLIMALSFYCMENISQVGFGKNQESHLVYFHLTGMISFGASVLISNLKILSFSHSVSAFQTFSIFGSYLFYILCYVLYSKYFLLADIRNTLKIQFTTVNFYLVNIALLGVTYLIDIAFYVFSTNDYELKQLRKQQKVEVTVVYQKNTVLQSSHQLMSTNKLISNSQIGMKQSYYSNPASAKQQQYSNI